MGRRDPLVRNDSAVVLGRQNWTDRTIVNRTIDKAIALSRLAARAMGQQLLNSSILRQPPHGLLLCLSRLCIDCGFRNTLILLR